MTATHRSRAWVAVIACVLVPAIGGATRAQASTWTVPAQAAASGVAQAIAPQPPSTVAATCTTGSDSRTVTVTWTAAAYATSYVVYQSTTSSTAGFSVVATGVTDVTWTSSVLKKGTYWYAVATVTGAASWTSAMSTSSDARSIATSPRCS